MSDESGRFDVPSSATSLAGLTFKEAFQRFVLEDPTVTVAGERAINQKLLTREALKSGEWPQLGHRWPLDLTADRLVQEYCYIPLRILDMHGRSADPPAPASIRALAEVLAGRWQSFIGILSRGDLVAIDIDEKILGRGGWGRPNSTVDVQSGDLFDGDSGDERPFRRGLMLSVPLRPEPLSEPSSIENDGVGRPAAASQAARFDVRRLAPRLQLIHMAYEALGENLDAPLRPDLRLQKIIEYLKEAGLIKANDSISASSLKRYCRARRDAMGT
jgi:hypothetical protein